MSDYAAFLASKAATVSARGLDTIPALSSYLFPHIAHCVEFGLRAGSWGCFLGTGLGKTSGQLEYLSQTLPHHNGSALILTPLAVARQIEREGLRWGYDVRVIRDQSQAKPGINVCNYDRLDLLEPDAFGAVALDESGILKSFMGKTTRRLIESFASLRWKMAASATPSPNEITEIANHSEFLGLIARDEMLVRWFINDGSDTKSWRLKKHGVNAFYDWMSSWSRMAEHPRDLGFEVEGFDLPPLNIFKHRAASSVLPEAGTIFALESSMSATSMHEVKRRTSDSRAALASDLVTSNAEQWIVWCDTDYEADSLLHVLGKRKDIEEVRGSHSIDRKESVISSFVDGSTRVVITKGSIYGWGLNLQHCHNMVFVGRSFSYEAWFQMVRRVWRFGQKFPVNVHIIVADGEDAIGRVIDRKSEDHQRMNRAMVAAMKRSIGEKAIVKNLYNPQFAGHLPAWLTEKQ